VSAEMQTAATIPEEERQRADIYVLLARLLIRPPDETILDSVRKLKGGTGPLGEAISALAAVARAKDAVAIDDEYHALFIGLDLGELVPYASHYLTGALYDLPLANLREDMARRGIGWQEEVKEPEDHIAALCEMMAGLILGTFGDSPASLEEQRSFFDTHLAPWAGDFFTDLEEARAATFYMPLGRIGSAFLKIEAQAFQMAP
jgi:TorA maturation chaperone TorD